MRILRVLRKNLRPVPLQPQDFRPDRLRGQRVAAAVEEHVRADRRRQLVDLGGRARIDAVEHARSSAARRRRRRAACRGRWRCADRADRRSARCRLSASSLRLMKVKSPHQSSRGRCSAQPGCGTSILCGLRRARDDPRRRRRRARPSIRTSRCRCRDSSSLVEVVAVETEARVDPAERRRRAAASGARDRRDRRPPARNACSASGSRDRSHATPSPTSCT